ncbi:MAG: PAS domain-containing protein [Cyanobacteria bacterium J06621_3]
MPTLINVLRLFLLKGLIKFLWNRISKVALYLFKTASNALIRRLQASENSSGDIEGMMSDYAELLSQAHHDGVSPFILASRAIQYALELGRAGVAMKINNLTFAITVFAEGLDLIKDYDGNSFNHSQIDGFLRLRNSGAVIVKLNHLGQITTWGREAEKLFGFGAQEVLKKVATDSFIPAQDQGISVLQWLLESLYQQPRLFLLNTNLNVTATGEEFWVFWINLPIHSNGQVSEIMCIGIKLNSPIPMRFLIWSWRLSQHCLVQSCYKH